MTKYSYLTHLCCSRCAKEYDADVVQGVCECSAPLLAQYDLHALARETNPTQFVDRPYSLWRYHELLPVRAATCVVSLGETITPLLSLSRLGREIDLERLSLKDEGLLPTGTFKARGAAVGVSRARELGVSRIAMPTNGNAGAAWAAYGARAGMQSLVVMPHDAPTVPRTECAITGSRIYLVDGLIGDAGVAVSQAVIGQGYMETSTLKEPYRLEGKKTMGLELFEQLGWRVPDVIMYPTGGGVGLIGIFKALRECQHLGWIASKVPRIVAVQASGCAPVVKAWESGAKVVEPWPNASTVAFGITVPKPLGDFIILEALRATDGCAVAVDDPDIVSAQRRLATTEGLFVCPEGAACVAAASTLRKRGWLSGSEEVVIFNTGTGLLYAGGVDQSYVTLHKGEPIPPQTSELDAGDSQG
ncbi:MAG: threonine synthase [Candidatus Dormibacteria bacterium]